MIPVSTSQDRRSAKLTWLAVWLLVGLCTGVAQAGSGAVVALPLPHVKNRSGLLLEIDTRWIDGNGYRPVRVRILPALAGPAPADRTIEVTITPRSRYNQTRGTTVTKKLSISQGSLFAETSVPVPCSESWFSLDLEVREDGRWLTDLSEKRVPLGARHYYEWNETSPGVLIVDADAPAYEGTKSRTVTKYDEPRLPDFRALAGLVPTNYWNRNTGIFDTSDDASDADLLRLLPDVPRFELLPPASLPTSWIELTAVDVLFIPFDELQTLARSDAERFASIRSWLATGPVLAVYDVGDDFERLAELEELLEIPALDEGDLYRGWSVPDKEQYGKSEFDKKEYRNLGIHVDADEDRQSAEPRKPPEEMPFLVRAVERGRLAALANDPFPGSRASWNWFLSSLESQHWTWSRRFGLSLQHENHDYWKLLIPGVGQAPVNSFLVLISLFVIVIGPLNYFYLRRRGRLYLLLVTVPVGALLITGGLLVYALVTDGLSVRARIRSISEIDQRSGHSVSYSRQTYYAGYSPSSGLVFPADAAAIPIDFRPQFYRSRGRRTRWGRHQRLSGGSFPSRTTVQYLVVESRPLQGRLEFGERDSDGTLPVVNHLGIEIDRLIVCDADDSIYKAELIGDGRSATLTQASRQAEFQAWNALLAQHRPQYPTGFDPRQIENAADVLGLDYRRRSRALNVTFTNNVFEDGLRRTWRQPSSLGPRSYLAIVEQGPTVSLGAATDQQASFHVVIGKW